MKTTINKKICEEDYVKANEECDKKDQQIYEINELIRTDFAPKYKKLKMKSKNGNCLIISFHNFDFLEEKLKIDIELNESHMSLVTTGKEIIKRDSDNFYSSENQMANNEPEKSDIQVQSKQDEDEPVLDEYRRGSMLSKQSFCRSK